MAAFTSMGSESWEKSLRPAGLTALTLKMYCSPWHSPWHTNLWQDRGTQQVWQEQNTLGELEGLQSPFQAKALCESS